MKRYSFHKFSHVIAEWTGKPLAFIMSLALIITWAVTGPSQGYSDTWQLIVNTTTTIITFLMVFLIQNTQNRDTKEIHLKLDELIRTNDKARNSFINLEDMSDEELDKLHDELCRLKELPKPR